jgi:hypothetical protein
MDTSIEKRLHELREIAGKYAEARATKEYLDHFRKSKKAILMKQFAVLGFKTTAAQEREALASHEYIALLEGLRDATREAEQLRWKLEIARMGSELWRTEQANNRIERKGYGM